MVAVCGCRSFSPRTLEEVLKEGQKELQAKFSDLTEAYHDACFKRDYWQARSDAARVYAEQMASRVAMVEKRWADLVIAQSTLSRLPKDEHGYITIPYQIIEDMARVAAS